MNDIHVFIFETLGTVRGHKMHRIGALFGLRVGLDLDPVLFIEPDVVHKVGPGVERLGGAEGLERLCETAYRIEHRHRVGSCEHRGEESALMEYAIEEIARRFFLRHF